MFDKELAKFENSQDLSLNFITYDNKVLHEIDIDNTDMNDLSDNNKFIKEERIRKQKDYVLTDDVFKKNRMIKKEYQEAVLKLLISNDQLFDSFYNYVRFQDILLQFTQYSALNKILKIFQEADLLDEKIVKKYTAISISYCKGGFKELLNYELRNAEKNKKTIDRAYMDSFKTQKELIEHKIPKILTLFESLFISASKIRGKNIDNFSLSKVIRFYETGVKSYFGEQLVEFGFPVDAIRRIENQNRELIGLNAELTRIFVEKNMKNIIFVLDEYEKKLIKEAISTIF